jgi:hypothetical protein
MPKKETKKTVPKKKAVKETALTVKENLPENINVNPHSLIQQAITQKVPIEVLERLLVMREKLQKEAAEIAFREAMSRFQSEIPVVEKKKRVYGKDGKLRYAYAPLEDIVVTVQPFLEKNKLSYDIDTEMKDDMIAVKVTVSHVMGHTKDTHFKVPIDYDAYMTAPQKFASAQTYAKRYAFCNGFGILTGDDDNDANNGVNIDSQGNIITDAIVESPQTAQNGSNGAQRQEMRVCPVCGEKTIIKGKEQYGGGYVCWIKKGGCGSKFQDEALEQRILTAEEMKKIKENLPEIIVAYMNTNGFTAEERFDFCKENEWNIKKMTEYVNAQLAFDKQLEISEEGFDLQKNNDTSKIQVNSDSSLKEVDDDL